MKRFFATLFVACFCVPAFADFKLILENRFYDDIGVKNYRPMMGINWHQKFMKSAAYNTFTGVGSTPLDEVGETDAKWFTTRHQINMYLGKLTIAPGISFTYVGKDGKSGWREYAYFRVEYKLF
jgi:hypothetical protein